MTFPVDMPVSGASLQQFELQRVDYAAPEAGGRVGGVQAGNPLWAAVWQLGKMGAARSDQWRAWLMRLRGAQRTFLGRDIARQYPLLYPAGFAGMTRAAGGAFAGTLSYWGQSISADGDALLTIAGLPAGFVLSVGDYVGWRWDAAGSAAGSNDRRTLARAVETVTADGSGNMTIRIEPPVPSLVVPAGAVAHLDRPACVMRLLIADSELGPIDRRLAVSSGKISAIQDLRP